MCNLEFLILIWVCFFTRCCCWFDIQAIRRNLGQPENDPFVVYYYGSPEMDK